MTVVMNQLQILNLVVLCVQDLADYWQHKYDWRQAEKTINSFLNYKVQVNGIDLHFLHERSSDPDATPLIFTHGWPGSFVEAFHIIKKLTTPGTRTSFQV